MQSTPTPQIQPLGGWRLRYANYGVAQKTGHHIIKNQKHGEFTNIYMSGDDDTDMLC